MPTVDRPLLAAMGGALLCGLAAAWVLLAPGGEPGSDGALPAADTLLLSPAAPVETPPGDIVVDVEGGVLRPGIQRLPAGARVADAIAAAGGYAPDADLVAAASALNLAKQLSDGEQVTVPVVGVAAAPAGVGSAPPGSNGLVNLNTATPEELEALPGVGPVTVQRIVAGRAEQPFTSLEDAVERGVLDRGQLEEIRDLATAA